MIQPEISVNNYSNGFTPNIPQGRALFSLAKSEQEGKNKYLLVSPSGSGKTMCSAFATYNFDGRILYIAHRNEILIQAKEEFKKVHNIKDEDIGFYNGTNKQIGKKITFATIQTISKIKNLESFAKDFFGYIILDEWHHVAAPTYKRFLNYFKPKHLLGMTATPYRLDGKDILQHVNYNIPFQMELKEGIETGELVPPIFYGLWDDVDYSDIEWDGRRYTQKDLDKKLLINRRDDAVIKKVKEKMGNRKCIGFCCSIKHIERCVKKFNKAGFSTVGLHHKIGYVERTDIVKNFRKGKYQIIFTVDLFNEGVDFPGVDGILFLRPTCSKRVFFQQLGRGLRKKDGKENVLVLDFIGNYANAYLVRKWLGEIIPTGGRGTDSKPEYTHNTPEVHFDDRVIDLFEMQEPVSDKTIVEDYYKLKEEIGRIPYTKEFKWGSQARYRWGTWYKFLNYLGESTALQKDASLEEFRTEYFRLKKLLKQTKSLTTRQLMDLRKRGIARFTATGMSKRYGISYSRFLFDIGEKPNAWSRFLFDIGEKPNAWGFLDEKLLKELYIKAKEKKGNTPYLKDMPCSLHIVKKLGYDSWASFVESMGDEPDVHHARRKSKQELIDDVRRVWDKLGKQPTIEQYNKNGLYSDGIIIRKFNMKWTEFIIDVMGGHDISARMVKDTYLEQWIKTNKISEFDLGEFFKAYPKQRKHIPSVDSSISKLINEGKLYHGADKDSFIVDWLAM